MFKRFVSLAVLIVLLVTVFAGCGGAQGTQDSTATTAKTVESTESTTAQATEAPKEPVELTFMLFGDKPVGMDEVLAEFEKRTKDTLNTKIDIIWTPFGEFKNKVKLKLAAGEDVDSVFDAPWWGMTDMISQDSYQNMDKYFLNDEYPGLKGAFSEEFVNNNKFNGHVFGIPFAQGYKSIYGFFIRKDLRLKFGMDKISNIDELETYFDKIKEYDSKMIPLADDGAAMRWGYGFDDENENYNTKASTFTCQLGGSIYAGVKLSSDFSKVISIEFGGDRTKPQIGIPYDKVAISKRWKDEGYFEKDVLTQANAMGLFLAGKAGAVAHEVTRFPSLATGLVSAVPDGQVEFFVSSDSQRLYTPGAMKTDYKTSNYVCIPVSTKKTEAVMKFFDWIFTSKENHDLFELGIQGKDWNPVGDSQYEAVAGSKYAFPGYELTWNSTMVRNLAGMDPEVYKILDYQLNDASYYQTPLSGFNFNSETVKNQIVKVTDIFNQIGQIYTTSTYGDNTWVKAHELNQKAYKLGLSDIKEEAIKQINEYLTNGK